MSDIQDIKAKYGQAAEGIIANGLNLVRKGSKYRCPNGIAHKNSDRNPSMSWDRNALQFHCFTCGMNIDLYAYYRALKLFASGDCKRVTGKRRAHQNEHLQKSSDLETELKKITPITQECIDYIKLRV